MKMVKFLSSLIATVALVFGLNTKWGKIPPMGKFLSPQHGFWQNADKNADFKDAGLRFSNLKGKVSVYMDDRLVPHVFAENEEDLFFVQGYLHAKYRLWQMEFQTMAAAGRISEIVGDIAITYDRNMRRLGMVYAAENSVKEVEKNPLTKMSGEAYTAGVNAYITSLSESELPFEYKLLDYKPEKWTGLKTALLLKYMSLDLAGYEDDFERTNAKAFMDSLMYETIYQYGNDSLSPIVPKGTVFAEAGVKLKAPRQADSAYFNFKAAPTNIITPLKQAKGNGSNNWAVSGSKTQSGRPILCNDPHLGLNLPSLWYEMQLSTPQYSAYGASLPGAPAVIIGFNDSCAFGFTNAMRDVRDYYEIQFKDDSKQEYFFNGQWQKSTLKYETIKVRGGAGYIDTVAYIKEFGPVMYDKSFWGMGKSGTGTRRAGGRYYAVRWKAHDPSNELLTFTLLNRAKNFDDYEKAISTFKCPGQNMIFASKNGDIAIRQQGEFPAKWYRQGDFPMPGTDSTFMWQGMIPQSENFMMHNPDRGFVSSANQYPYDTKAYPYYLGGNYPFTRGFTINRKLSAMSSIVPDDMKKLQNNNYNVFAEMMMPLLLKNLDETGLTAAQQKYLEVAKKWTFSSDINEQGPAVFGMWKDSLENLVWNDELAALPNYVWPEESTLLDALRRDSAMKFVDDVNTPEKETLRQLVTTAFKKAVPEMAAADAAGMLAWGKYKATMVVHLLDKKDHNMPLSRFNLPIGGGEHIINATKKDHGPSWRMIVQLTDKTEAYGVYPGGQSGNPGSPYYDSFIDTWANGGYYPLWMMTEAEKKDTRVKFTLQFSK
jgi:penicillin G amidase